MTDLASSYMDRTPACDQHPIAGEQYLILVLESARQELRQRLAEMRMLNGLDHVLDFEFVARYWPVLLIAAGVYLLYGRFVAPSGAPEEIRHERR